MHTDDMVTVIIREIQHKEARIWSASAKRTTTWTSPKRCWSGLRVCAGEALRVPRGERYELCRSVHAEANAIISASRRDMVGSTLYLVGRDAQSGALLGDATSCAMCRRQVINAGIATVIIRKTETEYQVVDVRDWVQQEDDVPAL